MAQSSEQINVYVRSDAEMEEVKQVVADLLVDDQENEHEMFFIRVRLGTVAEAVQRINEFGYSTDEDV
jgi:hypothetical protein